MKRRGFLSLAAGSLALPATAVAQSSGARRIISLAPSLTEMLFAIGAGPRVVGVSNFTTYPPAAAHLPVVATFASVDAERVVGLHPDLIVGIASQDAQVRDLRRAGLNVHLLADEAFDDIFTNIAKLGTLTDRAGRARALNVSLKETTAALVGKVPHRPSPPRIFIVLQVSPIYTVGNGSFIAHLIELAGGLNAAEALHAAYGRFSEEALVALNPDAIVADQLSGLPGVLGRPPWNALEAVNRKHAFVLTKSQADVLERPGPRYNEGLKHLLDIITTVSSS